MLTGAVLVKGYYIGGCHLQTGLGYMLPTLACG